MDKLTFKRLVSDIGHQDVAWRELAQKCADYYDHLQITAKRQQQLRYCEQLDLVGNLIQPTINSVLGHEEQRRVDWMVVADDEDSEEVAEGLNARLNETMRLCSAARYCSDAYKAQIIKGLGWLFVDKNPDPFGTPYLIEEIPLTEIWFDMRSHDPGLRDCRWLARRKYLDFDEAKAFFPRHQALIDNIEADWTSFVVGDEVAAAELARQYAEWSAVGNSMEHVLQAENGRRKRVAVYEVYYRVVARVRAIRFRNGLVLEFDGDNPEHVLALVMGQAQGVEAPVMKLRRKWFIGPHEVEDQPSPHPHNYYPFVPFWGYREDTRNTPYGIVRGMIDPQDAYNEAGFEIHRILDHLRVIKEEGTTNMVDSALLHELRRRDGVVNVKDGKLGSILVQKDWAELQALNGLQDKYAQQIRDYSGIYHSYSGRESSATSGVAIASMAELGATTLSEINANFEYGRKRLAELVLANLVEEIGEQPTEVRIRETGMNEVRKTVVLNDPEPSDGKANNRVLMARYQVALADVASSAGYRQHTHMRVMEMFQVAAADPALQRFLMELAIDTSELPNRGNILEKWRKLNGISTDPEQQAALEQQQADAAAQQQQVEQAKAQAGIAKDQADASNLAALAKMHEAKAARELAEIESLREKNRMEQAMLKADMIKRTRATLARQQLAAL